MLNFGASKPRVKGGQAPGAPGPLDLHLRNFIEQSSPDYIHLLVTFVHSLEFFFLPIRLPLCNYAVADPEFYRVGGAKSQWGVPTYYFCKRFAENSMKIKEFGMRGGLRLWSSLNSASAIQYSIDQNE